MWRALQSTAPSPTVDWCLHCGWMTLLFYISHVIKPHLHNNIINAHAQCDHLQQYYYVVILRRNIAAICRRKIASQNDGRNYVARRHAIFRRNTAVCSTLIILLQMACHTIASCPIVTLPRLPQF